MRCLGSLTRCCGFALFPFEGAAIDSPPRLIQKQDCASILQRAVLAPFEPTFPPLSRQPWAPNGASRRRESSPSYIGLSSDLLSSRATSPWLPAIHNLRPHPSSS